MLRRYHSLILLPCSMRQIPFTVPNQSVDVRRLARGSSEEYQPSGGLSEPTSPCVKRPSVEIPGNDFRFPILFNCSSYVYYTCFHQ